jgi:hypothetical protein
MALHWDAGSILPLTFCGSRAGATFSLAMRSTGGGLESLTSQRCRNNCLTLEMENGAPADFLGEPRPPPPCCVGGRGDGERSHAFKLNYAVILSYARMMAS